VSGKSGAREKELAPPHSPARSATNEGEGRTTARGVDYALQRLSTTTYSGRGQRRDDPVNRSLWTESVALQRKIAQRERVPLQVGANRPGADNFMLSAQCKESIGWLHRRKRISLVADVLVQPEHIIKKP